MTLIIWVCVRRPLRHIYNKRCVVRRMHPAAPLRHAWQKLVTSIPLPPLRSATQISDLLARPPPLLLQGTHVLWSCEATAPGMPPILHALRTVPNTAQHVPAPSPPPTAAPALPLPWTPDLYPVFTLTDADLLRTAGLDALMLSRLISLGIQILWPTAALASAVRETARRRQRVPLPALALHAAIVGAGPTRAPSA